MYECVCARVCKAIALILLLSIGNGRASISSEGHGKRMKDSLHGLAIRLDLCRSAESVCVCVSMHAFCGDAHISNTRAIQLNKHNLIMAWLHRCSVK